MKTKTRIYKPVTHIWTTHWYLMWADSTRNRTEYSCAPWDIPKPAPEFLIELPVVNPPCVDAWAIVQSPEVFGPPHEIKLHEFDWDYCQSIYFWRSREQAVADLAKYFKVPEGRHTVEELKEALAQENKIGPSLSLSWEDVPHYDGRDLNLDDCGPRSFDYNANIPLDALLKSNRRRWGNF